MADVSVHHDARILDSERGQNLTGPRRGAVVEAADHGSQSINAVAACEYARLGNNAKRPLKQVGVTTLIIDGFSHSDSLFVD